MWAGTRRLLMLTTPSPVKAITARLGTRSQAGAVGASLRKRGRAARRLPHGSRRPAHGSSRRTGMGRRRHGSGFRRRCGRVSKPRPLRIVRQVEEIVAGAADVLAILGRPAPAAVTEAHADVRAQLAALVGPGFVTARGGRAAARPTALRTGHEAAARSGRLRSGNATGVRHARDPGAHRGGGEGAPRLGGAGALDDRGATGQPVRAVAGYPATRFGATHLAAARRVSVSGAQRRWRAHLPVPAPGAALPPRQRCGAPTCPSSRHPRLSTASEHPVRIHQPMWLAEAKPVRKLPTTRAVSGRPDHGHSERLARSDGWSTRTRRPPRPVRAASPETAVLVIGAFTIPNPKPKIAYAVNSQPARCCGSSRVSISVATVIATPAATSDGARSVAADEPPGDRREDERHPGHRQGVQAGVQRGKPSNVLQIQGVQEQEATERGERAHRDHRGAGEWRAAEKPNLDQRLAAAALVRRSARPGQPRRTRTARRSRRSEARLGPSMIAYVRLASTSDHQHLADRIDPARARRLRLRHEPRAQHDGREPDRDVDPEDRAPADRRRPARRRSPVRAPG